MKKRLISILSLILCLCMLAACGGETDGTSGTTNTSGTTGTTDTTEGGGDEGPDVPENALRLVVDGASDYQIVYGAEADDAVIDEAYQIRWAIKQLSGVELPVVDDTAAVKNTEIIVGDTTRKDHYEELTEDYGTGYAVYIREQRIILEGGISSGLAQAVKTFVKDCFGYDLDGEDIYFAEPIDTLFCENNYQCVVTTFSLFANVQEASIVYDGSYMQMRLSYVLRDQLVAALGLVDNAPKPSLVKKENESTVEGNIIELVVDDELESGKWRLKLVGEDRIVLQAKDYYGFVSGARKLANYFKEQKDFVTKDQMSGDFRDALTDVERSSAYAFDQQSEYRIMFYNVLWDDTDVLERVELNTLLVDTYQPDVLGLQEVNKNKRGKTSDGKGGLIAELEKIGYVEAVDPRVKNAYPTNAEIPGTDAFATTGANAGTPLKGYGTSGANSVTVNGETYYTFFNCSPLFYNINTTRMIEAEYYWYKNQWDKRPGQSHQNWANDCGSKAATWGVFEDLETGERYIAISTHMCTRSDYIRGLQAQELVDLIEELVAEYDCPVILGGDFNGNYTHANFKCFEENGFTDVEKNNLASLYTSKCKSYHRPYPARDQEKGCVQPTPDDDFGAQKPEESVDHIMIGNVAEEEVSVYVYGVVIDESTLSGADHFPIFMDFTINSEE